MLRIWFSVTTDRLRSSLVQAYHVTYKQGTNTISQLKKDKIDKRHTCHIDTRDWTKKCVKTHHLFRRRRRVSQMIWHATHSRIDRAWKPHSRWKARTQIDSTILCVPGSLSQTRALFCSANPGVPFCLKFVSINSTKDNLLLQLMIQRACLCFQKNSMMLLVVF